MSQNLPKHLVNASVLITGCSSGIGLCVAQGLKRRGYHVIASARKPADVDILQQQGFDAILLDLDNTDSIDAAVKDTLEHGNGNIYAVFNNGAFGQPGAVEDLTRDVIRKQFETNLFGTMELTNRLIPTMRRQGYGRIIQNSSLLGLVVLPYRGAYNASKFAMEALTDTMRLELRDSGIHVSLIEPGPIASKFRKNAFAAYKQNIDKESSAHRDRYNAIERRLTKEGPAAPFTLQPEAVLKKVIHALESPRPKPRYYVTVPTYFFAILKRIAPNRTLDWILTLVSRGEHKS